MPLQLPANMGTGTGGPAATDTLLVAAVDAPAATRASANYVCDGTNDHVEIVQALNDAQMCTSHTEPFAGNSGNMLGTIFPANSLGGVGTWGCVSDKAKVTAGENGTNHCRFLANGFFHAEYQFVAGFEYACDLTWQAGTAGICFEFGGATTNSSIDGVVFVLNGSTARILEGAAQTLAASTVRATATYSITAGTTQRLSFSYKGANRFVAKINGAVIHDITISTPTPPHDFDVSYTKWGPLTFHTTTSNNTFDNFDYVKLWGSGPVRLSPGRFKLGGTIISGARSLSLSGAGKRETTVDCTGLAASTLAVDLRGVNPTLRSFRVSGQSADGTVNAANGAGGVMFRNTTSVLEDVWFHRLNVVRAVSLNDDAATTLVEVRRCTFDLLGASIGLYNDKQHAEYTVVEGCDFIGQATHCIYETGGGSYGQQIVSNRFRYPDTRAIYISYTALGQQVGPVIAGNWISGSVNLEAAFGAMITGNQIQEASNASGVHLYKSDQNVITGNSIMWSDNHGIFIEGGSNNMVSGNAIAENGTSSATPVYDNVRIATTVEATPTTSNYNNIDGNTIRRSVPNDANAYYGNHPVYGVRITAGTGNKVTNNDIHQSGFAGDLSDSGTSTVTGGNRT